MSLFPGHIKPGGTLTIHLRSTPCRPVWVYNKVFIIDPNGHRVQCLDLLQPCTPLPMSEADVGIMRKTGEFYQATPLLMAAHYLRNEKRNVNFFVNALKGLRDSIHHYTTYQIPKDAPLGRYEVQLEASMNGETHGSSTAPTDYFFVEELRLLRVVSAGNHRVAAIENLSREPVLAQVCEFPADGGAEKYELRLIHLPPQSVSEISFLGTAFLLYLEGTEMIRLGMEDDPFCIRNPRVTALTKPDFSVYVFRSEVPEQEGGFQLTGDCAEVWELANGFRTRSLIRNKRNASSYDSMLKQELIFEVH